MKVLIVEDELLIAMDLEMAVAGLGHHVCAIAVSAADAIAQASAHRPDVTLMDIRLSGGSSGIDAAREIYARHRLRCIFLSANLDGAAQAALNTCEPFAFLGKPFLPIALRRALEMAERSASAN